MSDGAPAKKKKGIFFLYQVILLEKGTMLAVFLNNLISFFGLIYPVLYPTLTGPADPSEWRFSGGHYQADDPGVTEGGGGAGIGTEDISVLFPICDF